MKLELYIYKVPCIIDNQHPNLWRFGMFDPEAYDYEKLPEDEDYPADDCFVCYDVKTKKICICELGFDLDSLATINHFETIESTDMTLPQFWKLLYNFR